MMSIDAKKIAFALLMVALAARGLAQTPAPDKKKDIKITWLGHSAFEIVSAGGTDIIIDPFLTRNPATPTELKDLAHYHPRYVLVTHSHGDHLGDAIELAKMSKAKLVCVAMPEAFKRGELPKELFEGVNVGDLVKAGDVKIHVVPAMHSSEPSGRPVGFVLEFADGRSVYHEGDTWIFGDMALIQGVLSSEHHPDAGRRCSGWSDAADGVAGGDALFQAGGGNPDALRRVARVIDGGGSA
jgi:glyoxylase-like metal-dependent hydrolase (beta-lactamase superfamily II)